MPTCPVGVLGGAGLETVSSVFWPVGTGGFPPIENLLSEPTDGRFPLTQGGRGDCFFTNRSLSEV
jgi:hypothetical protein